MAKRKTEPEISEGFVERSVEQPASAQRGSRIVIHVNQDGGVDWDKTQEEVGDELLNVLTNDATMLEKIAAHPELSDDGSTGTADAVGWQKEEAAVAVDILDKIDGLLFSAVSKFATGEHIPLSISMDAFTSTEKEHEIIDPRMQQFMNDFLLVGNPKYRNLALLIGAHGTSTVRKFKEAIKAGANPENGPQVVIRPNGHDRSKKKKTPEPQVLEGQTAESTDSE
jgi:hypothetical protein